MVTSVAPRSTRRRFTLPEFLELADELELAGSQDWYEIIGGELVAHASPDYEHMWATRAMLRFLGDARLAGHGEDGFDRTVALDFRDADTPVEDACKPDAFFVTSERHSILNSPDTPSVAGAPDIVVEVLSHSTARFDRPPRGKKFLAYERAGVRYLWLVDTKARTLTVYERRGERLVRAATLRPGDELRCPLFPELSLPIATVFRS